MTDKLERLDYYTLLGAPRDGDIATIKRAFRTFARRYHPDKHADKPEDKRERAAQIYRRGSEAYQTLTDPKARSGYDKNLRAGRVRLTADDRERAMVEARLAAEPKKKQPTIRSPQARTYYEQAAQAAKGQRWRDAWKLMKQAVQLEPDNQLLDARLQQIEARLRRGGV